MRRISIIIIKMSFIKNSKLAIVGTVAATCLLGAFLLTSTP
jgi:hypothetical protein